MGAGVLIVEAIDVCHEEEVVGLDHGGSDGGEGVVVAEFDFLDELVRGGTEFRAIERTVTARVSFSLTMGITPMLNNSTNVF